MDTPQAVTHVITCAVNMKLCDITDIIDFLVQLRINILKSKHKYNILLANTLLGPRQRPMFVRVAAPCY